LPAAVASPPNRRPKLLNRLLKWRPKLRKSQRKALQKQLTQLPMPVLLLPTLPVPLSTPLPLKQVPQRMPLALLSMLLLMPLRRLTLPSNPEVTFWSRRGPLARPPFFLPVSHATL
jgi:hypothetical protein